MKLKGEQNIPPQNVPPCHVGHFELKAIKTQQTWEKFFTSFKCLKEFRLGACTRKKTITRDNFIYQKDLSTWHDKHLFIKHLVFASSPRRTKHLSLIHI